MLSVIDGLSESVIDGLLGRWYCCLRISLSYYSVGRYIEERKDLRKRTSKQASQKKKIVNRIN